MRDPVQIQGVTARWSDYSLLNGVIVHEQDASLGSYDPWEQFNKNAGAYRTVNQPYVQLLELNRKLKECEASKIRPSRLGLHPKHIAEPEVGPRTDADRLILEWCKEHGLLGLVPVLSNSIRLPAIIKPEYELIHRIETRHYFKDGGFWHGSVRTGTQWAATAQEVAERARAKADEESKPGVTWWRWMTHFYDEKPLEHIERFFRPIWKDEPVVIPRPNTRTFWMEYGEPLDDFIEWCEMFAICVNRMCGWDAKDADEEASRAYDQSLWALSGLADSAPPTFLLNSKTKAIREERLSAGLLASYALMFLWDFMDGRRALQCQNCQRYFVSNERKAQYCSPKCRNTAQARRSREKRKLGNFQEPLRGNIRSGFDK